jgi:hypothetical protein
LTNEEMVSLALNSYLTVTYKKERDELEEMVFLEKKEGGKPGDFKMGERRDKRQRELSDFEIEEEKEKELKAWGKFGRVEGLGCVKEFLEKQYSFSRKKLAEEIRKIREAQESIIGKIPDIQKHLLEYYEPIEEGKEEAFKWERIVEKFKNAGEVLEEIAMKFNLDI